MIRRTRSRFPFSCLVGLLVLLAPVARADLFTNFELEGNPEDAAPGALPDDWDTVNGTGGYSSRYSGLVTDPPPDGIFMGPGSKDVNDIGNWACSIGGVRDRDEILNGMAAIYPGNFLYFACDRYGQEDYSYIGVWFLQNTLSCSGSFAGGHATGDLLLLAEFGYGGPTISFLFVWVGDGTGSHGNLDLIITDPTTVYLSANEVQVASPWPYESADFCFGCYPAGAFLEGGIDLTALGQTSNFSSFLFESRSSLSVDAQLFDFMIGDLLTLTPVPESGGFAPSRFSLESAVPNPFNPTTEIRYGIPVGFAPSRVDLAVFDLFGRRIRTLVDQEQGPGTYRVRWNGTDEHARIVASGTYIYRITWVDRVESRRMVLLK